MIKLQQVQNVVSTSKAQKEPSKPSYSSKVKENYSKEPEASTSEASNIPKIPRMVSKGFIYTKSGELVNGIFEFPLEDEILGNFISSSCIINLN